MNRRIALAFLMLSYCWLLMLVLSVVPLFQPVSDIQLDSPWKRMDTEAYCMIATQGYQYDPDLSSPVTFFPFFPKLNLFVMKFVQFPVLNIMLGTSNLLLFLTTLLIASLSQQTWKGNYGWTIAAFCLLPNTFFLRMPMSEAMFCFLAALSLYGMHRYWPIWVLALIAGIASGTRPVGIAISVAVWFYAWRYNPDDNSGLPRNKLLSLIWLAPVSIFGLLLYMSYLWWDFNTPLAFAEAQRYCVFGNPKDFKTIDKICSLITLEPIWNVYNPNSQRYWMNGDTQSNPLFSCLFWNPIFYLFTWFLIGLGWWKKWLKDYEIILSVGLLLIPYVTRAYEMSMASHARFAAVVIPQYFVLGRLFAMMPPAVAGCLCGLMGLMMGLWTALFVAGYRFF